MAQVATNTAKSKFWKVGNMSGMFYTAIELLMRALERNDQRAVLALQLRIQSDNVATGIRFAEGKHWTQVVPAEDDSNYPTKNSFYKPQKYLLVIPSATKMDGNDIDLMSRMHPKNATAS